MRRRIFGKDDLLNVLIENRAGDFGTHLREIGAGIALQITLEISQRDHALADTRHDVRRNGRLSMTRRDRDAEYENE